MVIAGSVGCCCGGRLASKRSRGLSAVASGGTESAAKEAKKRRFGTSDNGCHRRTAEHKDHVWAGTSCSIARRAGATLKWLSIVDEHTRECLALKVGRSITSEDVIDTLAELFAMRGVPQHIRSDNGPEFIAQAIRRWLGQVGVETLYIAAGQPVGERLCGELPQPAARRVLGGGGVREPAGSPRADGAWQEDYNHHRPHSSLGYLTPIEFAARCAASAPASATPQSSSTARTHEEDLTHYPNPYLHNPWYRKSTPVSVTNRKRLR